VFKKLRSQTSADTFHVPVCLSTLDNSAETVDFLLTKGSESLANFLQFDKKLKICYVQRTEIKFDASKRVSVEEPSLADFEFIKTLGKGGFATVYMGKY